MYNRVVISVRTSGGIEFPITIGLHQGSALSSYLFALMIDELTKSTKFCEEEVHWCMFFANYIVLVDETKSGVSANLEIWQDSII